MQNLKVDKFLRAVSALSNVLKMQADQQDIQRDAAIQRFEFTFELVWKMLQDIFWQEGLQFNSPKEVFKHAFGSGLIQNETVWLQMLKDRNLTSHTYNEDLSKNVFEHLPLYLEEFLKLKMVVQIKR